MRKLILIVACASALAVASTAAAALVPGVYDPTNTGCVTSTFSNGVLHLAKNCPTETPVAALGDITSRTGQTFTSGSFTLANATPQCQGGSPRFNVVTNVKTYFLGCNNVIPTTNSDGTVTYTFTPTTIAAGGNQVDFPTGTINSIEVIIDVQGTADVSNITVNGTTEVPAPVVTGPPTSKQACKHDGWKTFTSPSFKNQGQCVSYVEHHTAHGEKHHDTEHHSTKHHTKHHEAEHHSTEHAKR
jgi:hypothetical protein